MSIKTLLLSTLILLVISASAVAAPATAQQARTIVQAWLNTDMKPLGANMGNEILDVRTFYAEDGQPVYYAVNLQPSGFVIVPADDMVEPIICFVDNGTYDPSTDNPLGALVSNDLPGRVTEVRNLQAASQNNTQSLDQQQQTFLHISLEAQTKWNDLLAIADSPSVLGISNISEVWVAPMTDTTWGQTTVCGYTCYNYYTPSNYPCGCVATAMAQLMRYHQQPSSYTWSNMPLQPGCSITLTQRQAIGDLCYDAAESIDTTYGSTSWAFIWKVREALPDDFGYDNTIYAWNNNNNIGSGLTNMVNPNLDSGCPVLLGIFETGSDLGHAVLADGYGYNFSTLYHHISIGWDGYYDAWYNLPNIDLPSPNPSFNSVIECIYNVFYNGTGEIISGRITDEVTGNPISGVEVTAVRSGGGTYNAITDSNGIYALWAIPSASTYTVSAAKDGYTFTPSSDNVSTGTSTHEQATSGNQWGINFEGSGSSPDIYCDASSENCNQYDEHIGRVEIGDIDNSSGCSGYTDYTDISTQISGTSHIKVTNGQGYTGDLCGVWIDWNQDKVFDHPAELVLESSGIGPYEGDIIVPFDANEGYTRMRVRIQYYGTLNPCGVTEYGEVEDYNLVVSSEGGCDIVNIGSGNIDWAYPMHTYYHDSRTQIIYLADEIGPAGTIPAIALNITTTPGQTLGNWTIRMKHTPLSSYSSNNFQNTGWTTVYQTDETITDTGWQTFNLSTPFVYNGSDNLLVDFSHNNSSYTTNGECSATNTAVIRSLYAYSDSSYGDPLDWSGSTLPTVNNSTYVANLKLTVCRSGQTGQILTVTSSNPDSGVLINVTPADSNGDSQGVTPFTRTYDFNTPVILSAPITADGNSFKQWLLNDSYLTNTLNAAVVMDTNNTLTAEYEQILFSPMTVDLNGNGIPDFGDFSDFAQVWAVSSCLPPNWCNGRDFDHSGSVDMDDLQIFYEFWLWPVADIDLNGRVDFTDYAMLCDLWGQSSCQFPDFCDGCDLDKSDVVDMNDLSQMTKYWLFAD